MIIKNQKDILIILDKEIEKNYPSKAEFARKVGITRARLQTVLKKLENNNGEDNKNSLTFNTLSNILSKAGYQIKIVKK